MPLISYVIFGLAVLLMGLKLWLAVVLIARRMARAYPMLTIYAAGGFVLAAYLACHWGDSAAYVKAYAATEWAWPILTASVALEAFWGPAKSFRNFRPYAYGVIALFAVLGVVSAWLFSGIAVSDGDWSIQAKAVALLMARNFSIGCATFIGVVKIFFAAQYPKEWISSNRWLYIDVLLFLLAGEFSSRGVIHASSGSYAMIGVGQVMNVGIPSVCFWIWSRRLRPDGERSEGVPTLSKEEYQRGKIE